MRIHDRLVDPLSVEAALQRLQVRDDVPACANEGLLGCDTAICGDAELECSEERVGNFVGGEVDAWVAEQALGKEVAKGVVFFVEGEDSGVGDTCVGGQCWSMEGAKVGSEEVGWNSRVSSFSTTFFSSSLRIKSSNLKGGKSGDDTPCGDSLVW